MTKEKKTKKDNVSDAILYYFERKYHKSKLYRFTVKAYGYLAMIVIILAVSAIDYHPVGAFLWLVRVPLIFIALHLTIFTLDLVGFIIYETLRSRYDPVKVQERRKAKARKRQEQRQRLGRAA